MKKQQHFPAVFVFKAQINLNANFKFTQNELKYESEKADISLKRLKGSSCRLRETKTFQLNLSIQNVSVGMTRTILQSRTVLSCGISDEFGEVFVPKRRFN